MRAVKHLPSSLLEPKSVSSTPSTSVAPVSDVEVLVAISRLCAHYVTHERILSHGEADCGRAEKVCVCVCVSGGGGAVLCCQTVNALLLPHISLFIHAPVVYLSVFYSGGIVVNSQGAVFVFP